MTTGVTVLMSNYVKISKYVCSWNLFRKVGFDLVWYSTFWKGVRFGRSVNDKQMHGNRVEKRRRRQECQELTSKMCLHNIESETIPQTWDTYLTRRRLPWMFKIGFLLFGMGPKTKIETRLLLLKKPVEHCKWSLLMSSCIVTTAHRSGHWPPLFKAVSLFSCVRSSACANEPGCVPFPSHCFLLPAQI